LIVGDHLEHRRLDQFVAAALAPAWSRSQVVRIIKAGLIRLNGAVARASCGVRPGDRIEVVSLAPRLSIPTSRIETPKPAATHDLEVLFADEQLLAVNKPAGMTVHPSPGHPDSTLANALVARFPDLESIADPDGVMRAGIVHRLDKETSGVMVVARTPLARMALSGQFKDRNVSKVYLAIVHGIVQADRFIVDRPVGRHPTERKRMSIRSHRPRTARTEFLVLHRFAATTSPVTLLSAKPQTGRTHQIRVHLAASGHPCVGDTLYGGKRVPGWAREGQALHALALTIAHPQTGERFEFVAPPAEDIDEFMAACGLAIAPSIIRRWIHASRG
jgi:23S rRNA pseudouridine1911/1915/1917 synthase